MPGFVYLSFNGRCKIINANPTNGSYGIIYPTLFREADGKIRQSCVAKTILNNLWYQNLSVSRFSVLTQCLYYLR